MTKLNAEHAKYWERWKETAIGWLSVIIASAAAVISLINTVVLALCIGIIWSQENRIDDLTKNVDVYRIRAAKLNAYLAAHDVPLSEIYGDEYEPE